MELHWHTRSTGYLIHVPDSLPQLVVESRHLERFHKIQPNLRRGAIALRAGLSPTGSQQ
jgi:hypothetical protein